MQTSFSVDPPVRWSLPTVDMPVALAILTLGMLLGLGLSFDLACVADA